MRRFGFPSRSRDKLEKQGGRGDARPAQGSERKLQGKNKKPKKLRNQIKLTEHDGDPGRDSGPRVRRVDGLGNLPLQQQRAKFRGHGNGGGGRRAAVVVVVVVAVVTAVAVASSSPTSIAQHLPPPFDVGSSHDHDRVLAVGLEHDDGGARRRRRRCFLLALFLALCLRRQTRRTNDDPARLDAGAFERGPQASPRRVVPDAADHPRRETQARRGRGLVAALGVFFVFFGLLRRKKGKKRGTERRKTFPLPHLPSREQLHRARRERLSGSGEARDLQHDVLVDRADDEQGARGLG